MTICNECGAADIEPRLLVTNDEELEICPLCETPDSVHYIDYEDWLDDMLSADADQYNDDLEEEDDYAN